MVCYQVRLRSRRHFRSLPAAFIGTEQNPDGPNKTIRKGLLSAAFIALQEKAGAYCERIILNY